MSPNVKRAFLNLQIAILQTIMSNGVSPCEANAYRKLSRLILSMQKDYEELFDWYKRIENIRAKNKKLVANELANQQQPNMSIKLYQFEGRV